jgi:hypothetical protein
MRRCKKKKEKEKKGKKLIRNETVVSLSHTSWTAQVVNQESLQFLNLVEFSLETFE